MKLHKRHRAPEPQGRGVEGAPTDQRLGKAGADFALGGDERDGRRYVMRDNPLDMAQRKGILSGRSHSALKKYLHHWHHAGLNATLGSVDLNRIFASDPLSSSGMARSQSQAFHRLQYREAVQKLGIITAAIVENVVCWEMSFQDAGMKLGFRSPFRGRTEAVRRVQEAGDMLARLWGIG